MAVVEDVEIAVGEETVVVAAAVVLRRRPAKMARIRPRLQASLGTRAPSIQICLLESGRGARCIISGGSQLSSVLSRPHVRGRMCTPLSQKRIEGQANSV